MPYGACRCLQPTDARACRGVCWGAWEPRGQDGINSVAKLAVTVNPVDWLVVFLTK